MQRADLLAVLEPLSHEVPSRAATVTGAGKVLKWTVLFYAQWLARHERQRVKQPTFHANAILPEGNVLVLEAFPRAGGELFSVGASIGEEDAGYKAGVGARFPVCRHAGSLREGMEMPCVRCRVSIHDSCSIAQ